MPERVHRVVVVTGVTSAATTAALAKLAALRESLGLELLMTSEEAARHDDQVELGQIGITMPDHGGRTAGYGLEHHCGITVAVGAGEGDDGSLQGGKSSSG